MNHTAVVQADGCHRNAFYPILKAFPQMAIVIRNYHTRGRGAEYRKQVLFSGTSLDEPKLLAREVLLSGAGWDALDEGEGGRRGCLLLRLWR